jgi:hypothetical protein
MSSLGPSQPKRIPRAEAIRLLHDANLELGPNTGNAPFEVWVDRNGYPQNLFYAGSRDYFWLHEVQDAIKGG